MAKAVATGLFVMSVDGNAGSHAFIAARADRVKECHDDGYGSTHNKKDETRGAVNVNTAEGVLRHARSV